MKRSSRRLGTIASISCLSLLGACSSTPQEKIVVQSINTICTDVPPTPRTDPGLRTYFAEHPETAPTVDWILLVTRRRSEQCVKGGPR